MDVIAEIIKTFDYSLFKFIKGNRPINQTNKAKLLRSMRESYLIVPICVNERLEIIDGQHRFTCAKELGLPIYYYVIPGYGNEEVKRLNMIQLTWTIKEHIDNNIQFGNPAYPYLSQLLSTTGLTLSALIKLISTIKRSTENATRLSIISGAICITELEKSSIEAFLNALQDFESFPEFKSSRFICAFIELYYFEAYNHSVMKSKLSGRIVSLRKETSKGRYLETLTYNIYSFGAVRNKLLFDINRNMLYVA